MATRRKARNQNGGVSPVKVTIVVLTCVPMVMLFATLHHSSTLMDPHASGPDPIEIEETERVTEEVRILSALKRASQSAPVAGATTNAAPAAFPEAPPFAEPATAGSDTSAGTSSSGAGAGDHDDEPSSAERNAAKWEAKRKFIGSEPMSGDWLLDCPPTPPPGYPNAYPIMDIVDNWSPDKPTPVPPKHFHALCRFDWTTDQDKANAYRDAEVPYILYNNPQAEEVVHKWATPNYLEKLLGGASYRTEVSHNNHFMYFSGGKSSRSSGKNAWRAPVGAEQMSFSTFKEKALACERRNCTEEEEHYYFRITGQKSNHFIFKELPFYMPKRSALIKDPRGQRGIHCRFGMKAVIAENHYDGSRNVIGVFGGRRRYILSHPNQCESMYLLPMGHPSGRHSGDACNFDPACKDAANSVDYSNPDLERWPKFANLQANEVILSPGDFLYLPTHWFHYIISLGLNYQCNTRSGRDEMYTKDVKKCGFK